MHLVSGAVTELWHPAPGGGQRPSLADYVRGRRPPGRRPPPQRANVDYPLGGTNVDRKWIEAEIHSRQWKDLHRWQRYASLIDAVRDYNAGQAACEWPTGRGPSLTQSCLKTRVRFPNGIWQSDVFPTLRGRPAPRSGRGADSPDEVRPAAARGARRYLERWVPLAASRSRLVKDDLLVASKLRRRLRWRCFGGYEGFVEIWDEKGWARTRSRTPMTASRSSRRAMRG